MGFVDAPEAAHGGIVGLGAELWMTRTFQMPDIFVSECQEGGPRVSSPGRSSRGSVSWNSANGFPITPADDASASAWQLAITQCSAIVSRWLAKFGLEGPDGSAFFYEESSATLVVKTTSAYMALLEPVFDAYKRKAPQMLLFELEVLEADADLIRLCLSETRNCKDHTEAFLSLRDLTELGEVKCVRQMRLETRPGQCAVSESDFDDIAGFPQMNGSSLAGGTRLVVEADVDPDETDLDLKIDFSFQCSPEGANGATADKDRRARLVTTTMMGAGTTRILSVWTCPPSHCHCHGNGNGNGSSHGAAGAASRMQAAFLRADMVPALPLENARLAGIIEHHLSEPLPSSSHARVAESPDAKHRMEVSIIRVKPDFSPSRTGFTSSAVMEVLKHKGISFPQGARADLIPAVSLLVARNTPRNLDAMQHFMEGMKATHAKVANVTMEIVEGDVVLMRDILDRSRSVADHRAVWEQVEALAIEGRMKLLRTVRLEVQHGEKGWFAAGRAGANAGNRTEVLQETSGRTAASSVRVGTIGKGATILAKRNGAPSSRFTAPARLVGTWLEVSPTVSGPHMDVELEMEHHYAPALDHRVISGDTGYRGDGEPARASCRKFRCRSSITARQGMVRLVGVWTPDESRLESARSVMQAAFLRVDLAWAKARHRS